MRVRYGKPIKVKNCYPYTKSITIFPRSGTTSNSYLEVVHYDDTKVFSNVQDNLNHLYFFYAEINGNTSSLRSDILLGSNSLKQQSRYVNENKFCAVAKLTSVGVTSVFFYINSNQQIGDFTVLFHCGIDLTEAFGSGKEPTAQQFYNKYNKYFPLIATGEEITIDDKAGQVSLFSQLPRDFQQVEYIESNSNNNYIDTGINASSTLGLSYKMRDHSGRFGVLGADDSKRHHSYDTTALYGYASGGYGSNTLDTDTKVKINWLNDRKLVKNNESPIDIWTGDFDAEITYPLFARYYRTQGVLSPYWQGRIYYFKMSLVNQIVRDFIPCYNKYTNDIGLYDLCNSGKNLCFRTSLSHYSYSYDYLRYNASKAVYLEKGTYTYTCSNQADAGIYLQFFSPTDTSTNVTITTAVSYRSKGGTAWDDKLINVDKGFNSLTFTLTDNYIVTICSKANDADIINPQIERGTTATTYEHSAFYINQGTGTFLKGNNTSSCKVAGGSSDIYYGYNQKVNSVTGGNTGGNVANKTYDEANNEFTLTANSTTPSRSYFGLSCNNLSSLQSHRALCIAKVTAISITNSFSDISFSWALGGSTITDRNNVTTAGNWVYAIGTWGASTTANYLNVNSATPVEGDYFKVKDVQIIDLTDWFGAGEEPTTLAQFRQKFIKEYYGFCPTPIKLTRYQIEALPNYGYNQMLKNGNFVDSSNWAVNTTSQRRASIENNIYTIETLTQGYAVSIEQSGNAQFLYADHKYLVSFEARGTSAGSTTHLQASIKLYSYANSATIFNQSYQDLTDEFQEIASIITPTQTTSGTSASGGFRIYYQSNTGLSYVGDKVQMKNIYVVDLTDWYGSGNEPTTVAEFKATFPNKYYPYSKKRLLNKYMINKLID